MLKPNVVFFGDNVPKDVTQKAVDFVKNADGLLVVGSSLEVLSAYRFVRMAANEFQIPIAIINQGITRAEREGLPIEFKSEMDCSKLLDAVVKELTNTSLI
jgi:NAD-dependent SIR2 family protein deacetylase